jgi:hypothetical protein
MLAVIVLTDSMEDWAGSRVGGSPAGTFQVTEATSVAAAGTDVVTAGALACPAAGAPPLEQAASEARRTAARAAGRVRVMGGPFMVLVRAEAMDVAESGGG